MEEPKSFRDPYYATVSGEVEQRLGLPTGMLSSIITHGERSNSDQVSEAGARTVAQIIPATRNAALKLYGIDAYLSPKNALEVAGRLLQDSLKRNDGDPVAAVGEYIGGTDRKNWGKTTSAYIDRVTAGMQMAKTSALDNGFSKWMAEHPAAPAAAALPGTAAAPAAAKPDPLAAGFGQWLQTKNGAEGIPGQSVQAPPPDRVIHQPGEREPGMVEKIVGAGEAGLNAATALTGGTAGLVAGTVGGLTGAVLDGKFGTPEGARQVEQSAAKGADALTYSPRTASGQEQAEAVGNVMQQVLPVAPVMGGVAGTVRPAGQVARGVLSPMQEAVKAKVEAAKVKAAQAFGAEPAVPPQATPGTMGSVGAAGTDMATLRRTAAQDLPVPIDLTKGQAERGFEQQRFEREMAKDPVKGQALRERFEDQNARAIRNFDVFVDETGAQKVDPVAVGDTVTRALRERAAADKARIRVAYKNAEKAGAMEAPVSLENVVSYLNESAPDAATAPLLTTVRNWAKKLGIAEESADGTLVPAGARAGSGLMNTPTAGGAVNLKLAETFRQAINRNTDFEPTNIRQATILKGLIDEATDGLGGDLYQKARLARRQYAERYENFGLARDLLNNKRGMSDAIVPAEKVFQKAILSAPMADVKQIGRLLKSGGEPGRQAWAELQGAALRHIKDEATKNTARDSRGNPIVSVAGLDSAVKQLDSAGKLDYMFGKKGAEQLRAINDLAKDIYTAPPGAVNHSNTASVILAALDMATSGLVGMPAPVFSGLRILTTHVKDRQIQKRIRQALGIADEAKPVKAPRSIVPPAAQASRVPENRTVH